MTSQTIGDMLPLLVPLILLSLALEVGALVDLWRRPRVRFDSKLVWLVIILFVNLLGPLAYFVFGRGEE